MNEKIKIMILCAVVFSLVGLLVYGMNHQTNNKEKTVTYEEKTNNSKILVAYFSRSGENYAVGNVAKGNTQIVAENIAGLTSGNLYAIEPENPYPNDYEETKQIASQELETDARPKIKTQIESFDQYDVVFIGYPIWHGDYPMIINTFMESYDFSKKTVIPFNTHEGSGSANTYETIEKKLSTATVLEGLCIKGSDARNDESKQTIVSWLESLELKNKE